MHPRRVTTQATVARTIDRRRAIALGSLLLFAACALLASTALASRGPGDASASELTEWTFAIGLASWPALAGLGLAAVVVGAATARRPRLRARKTARVAMPADRLPILTVAPEPQPGMPPVSPCIGRDDRAEPAMPDATSDARTYLALHHVDLAIETLRRHVEREDRAMPVAWLMLLDLYRTHGREQAFRDLAERFHQRFNAQQPEWNRYPPDGAEPGLEAFPRLIKEITVCWGTHECRRVLDRLLYDNRNGRRMGFTLNAYNDLLALRRICDELLATIEADFTEEAALRAAFAAARAGATVSDGLPSAGAPRGDARADETRIAPGQLTSELEAQLADDLRAGGDARSALELEQPALAGMLAREWGNSALAARLCEILAHGALAAHPLSPEAAADLATLRRVAGDLADSVDRH